MSYLVTAEISCDKQCTSTALFTILTVFCSRVLIRSGKSDEHADEIEKESCLLLQKMDALDKLDNGMRITAVGGHNAVNESTIQVIDKNKDQMSGSVKASVQSCANISCANSRHSLL